MNLKLAFSFLFLFIFCSSVPSFTIQSDFPSVIISMFLSALADNDVKCDDIHYAIGTHGHSDHLGNLNLFTKAKHIVGYTVSFGDIFFIHPFETGMVVYVIDSECFVI